MATNKGFIKDWYGEYILPITRGELVLDAQGNPAFESEQFLAKNGHPGLVTAAERAMLNDLNSGGGSLTNVYTRIDAINNGLYFNDSVVHFYDNSDVATPINIKSVDPINITVESDNIIKIGLSQISTNGVTIEKFIKNITTDKFGRVTSISGSDIDSSDLPQNITGKVITNSTLTNCTTSTNSSDADDVIVNKGYVDNKFQTASGIATGALKFGGPLSSATTAISLLTSANIDKYYKITNNFELSTSYLNSENSTSGSNETIKIKVGDTLIIHEQNNLIQYVHIPSGDDVTISVQKQSGNEYPNVLTNEVGNITFRYSQIFDVTSPTPNTAWIQLHKASGTQDGYLSKEDYAKFNSYASNLSTVYTGEFESGLGVYKIGTLTIGGIDQVIYGKNNISSLALNNGTINEYNPILKFSETGVSDVNITFTGLNGISIKKNNNSIEFSGLSEVNSGSEDYLEIIDNYKFKIKPGSIANSVITNGITPYSEFAIFKTAVQLAGVTFESFTYSLNGSTSTTEYRYGNQKLKDAITITI